MTESSPYGGGIVVYELEKTEYPVFFIKKVNKYADNISINVCIFDAVE